jgi:hypothetical protein
MPTYPTTDFIVIQPGLAIAGLEDLFDAVSFTLGSNQLGQGHLGAGVGHGIVDLQLADWTDHDQTLLHPNLPNLLGPDPDGHRIDFQRLFLPRTHRQSSPLGLRLALGPGIDSLKGNLTLAATPDMAAAGPASFLITHLGVAWHVQNVALGA